MSSSLSSFYVVLIYFFWLLQPCILYCQNVLVLAVNKLVLRHQQVGESEHKGFSALARNASKVKCKASKVSTGNAFDPASLLPSKLLSLSLSISLSLSFSHSLYFPPPSLSLSLFIALSLYLSFSLSLFLSVTVFLSFLSLSLFLSQHSSPPSLSFSLSRTFLLHYYIALYSRPRAPSIIRIALSVIFLKVKIHW